MSASDVQDENLPVYGGWTLSDGPGDENKDRYCPSLLIYDNMVTKCVAKNLKIDVASARNAKDPFPVRKTQTNTQTKNHLKAG